MDDKTNKLLFYGNYNKKHNLIMSILKRDYSDAKQIIKCVPKLINTQYDGYNILMIICSSYIKNNKKYIVDDTEILSQLHVNMIEFLLSNGIDVNKCIDNKNNEYDVTTSSLCIMINRLKKNGTKTEEAEYILKIIKLLFEYNVWPNPCLHIKNMDKNNIVKPSSDFYIACVIHLYEKIIYSKKNSLVIYEILKLLISKNCIIQNACLEKIFILKSFVQYNDTYYIQIESILQIIPKNIMADFIKMKKVIVNKFAIDDQCVNKDSIIIESKIEILDNINIHIEKLKDIKKEYDEIICKKRFIEDEIERNVKKKENEHDVIQKLITKLNE